MAGSAGLPRAIVRAVIAAAAIVMVGVLHTPAAAARENPTSSRSVGCGQAVQATETSVRYEISSGGRQREFLLHLPAGYDGGAALPVVLAFHGHGRDGAFMEELSKLSRLSAIVVYPDGVTNADDGDRRSWQGAPYAASDVDDVAFIADLLDRLEYSFCVDTTRVYATGKSNGGGFIALLACRMADRIAAIAPVAGAFYPATGESCLPAPPVPVIEFHGTADPVVPYTGGTRDLPAIPDWVAGRAERNGCPDRRPDVRIEPDIAITDWGGCAGEVRHVAIDGGGHTWPGAENDGSEGSTTQTIEAHEMIWDFLRQYQLLHTPTSP